MSNDKILFDGHFAVIERKSDQSMPRILAITEIASSAHECRKRSGWEHDPNVGVYELIKVG